MDRLLNREIINQRRQLEYLIRSKKSLQNKDVLNCSKKLDVLIIQYHEIISHKRNLNIIS